MKRIARISFVPHTAKRFGKDLAAIALLYKCRREEQGQDSLYLIRSSLLFAAGHAVCQLFEPV